MFRPLVRSLVSVVVAACFALSATSWGRPLDCAGHSSSTGQHQGPQDPSHHHGQPPAGQACAVHLCCAHVTPGARTTLAAERLGEIAAARGFAVARVILAARSPHTLPFAQAPPLLI
jgi:hypothetical protein